MSRLQRPDNKRETNLMTAEFTSGQLVVAICLSLFVAMACFGLGILVARVDPAFEQRADTSEEQEIQVTETVTYEMPAYPEPSAESVPVPAQTDAVAQRTPETPAPRSPFMDNKPRLTALPPLSSQRPAVSLAEAPTRAPRPESDTGQIEVVPSDEEGAAEATAPESVSETTTPKPSPQPASEDTTPPPAPEPEASDPPLLTPIEPVEAAPPAVAASASRGQYGVQLAAFSGDNRRSAAQTFQQRMRSELNVNAEIVPSADDSVHRVVVAGFSSKAAADAACVELRRKPNLGEAFVRSLY